MASAVFALAAAEAHLLRAFNVRGVYASDGAKSASAWLARRTRAPKGECAGRVRLGRLMEELPVAGAAFAAGAIGAAHLRGLAGARNPRTEVPLARDEPMLVDQARRRIPTPADVGREPVPTEAAPIKEGPKPPSDPPVQRA